MKKKEEAFSSPEKKTTAYLPKTVPLASENDETVFINH